MSRALTNPRSPVFAFIGPDSATHMSEEIKDASSVLPRAMMWTVVINGSMGFVMLVTFCFCLGDVDAALANPDVMPFVQVFLTATKSKAGTNVLTAILIILTTCGCITNVATASRQMFAFARDMGLPYSKFLAKVRETFYFMFVSYVLTNIKTGSSRMGRPFELGSYFFCYHSPIILDQYWLYYRLQRHCLPWCRCSYLFLHRLH